MDFYRIVVCLLSEDDDLASTFLSQSSSQYVCYHFPLPNHRSKVCCKPRRIFYKVIRPDMNERIAPRKSKDDGMPFSWTENPQLSVVRSDDCNSDDEDTAATRTNRASSAEIARQIHRLADYFAAPPDVSKQLEMICCFSNPSVLADDESGQECLFSALLRMVEYQQSHITFLCTAEPSLTSTDDETSNFPRDWIQKLGGQIVYSDGNLYRVPSLPTFWKGGVRLTTDLKSPVGGRVWGLEMRDQSSSDVNKTEDESIENYCVPMATSRWLEIIQKVVVEDICPLAISKRRWKLAPQSGMGEDAVRMMKKIHEMTNSDCALLCRLDLYVGEEDKRTSDVGSSGDSDFMPGSEQWLSQLSNDVRLEQAGESIQCHNPQSDISLHFLLVPSSATSMDLLSLRFPWELPLSSLVELATLSEPEDEDDMEECSGNWRKWAEELSVTLDEDGGTTKLLELPTRPPTEADLRGTTATTFLDVLIAKSGNTERDKNETREGVEERKEKVEVVGDHLIEQILKCFHSDGTAALTPICRVKAERRPLIDKVEQTGQLHWPKAMNTFYHGIYYNRGSWCEAREERITQIQASAIQHETMCTVTRQGCRGNATSATITVPTPEKKRVEEKKRKIVPMETKENPNQSRSARHEQKLRDVVNDVLDSNGISPSHSSRGTISTNLFEATKTMIKMQKLPNSHNLKEKMKETAQLQFQVMKQIFGI